MTRFVSGRWPRSTMCSQTKSQLARPIFSASLCGKHRTLLAQKVLYFKPSLFPAERTAIDSRIRLSRVSARLAV